MSMITGNESATALIKNGGLISEGLTIRQHFAANAPNEIPQFFRHTEPQKNITPVPKWEDIENEDDAKLVRDWLHDGIFDLPDHLKWFSDAVNRRNTENDEWHRNNNYERYFQWRTFYADALIKELNKVK